MTLVFNPGVNPSFDFDLEESWPIDEVPAIKPYVTRIPKTIRPVRTVRAVYRALSLEQREYIQSFFHEISGAGEFFFQLMDPVASPKHRGPDLTTVVKVGAPAGARTYDIQYTWHDPATGQESRPSPKSTIAVPGGSVVKVEVPIFPMGVPAFRVYAGEAGGNMWSQAHSTLRTWEQPAAELLTLTSLAPAGNTLKPLIKFCLLGGLSFRKFSANRWSLDLLMLELHA